MMIKKDIIKKKRVKQQFSAIIPPYLFEQIEEMHKNAKASSKILKQDKCNIQKSNRLRKQREDRNSK